MRRILAVLVPLVSLMIFCISIAFIARQLMPTDIIVRITDKRVEIAVPHLVLNPNNHYIDHITILVNNWKAIDQTFTSQTDNDFQHAAFDVPAISKGVKVEVLATCNKGEKKKTELIAS